MSVVARLLRPWHRLVAWAAWLDVDMMTEQRSHTVKLIVQLEQRLAAATKRRHIAELQHALRVERAHLAGLDYSIRETNRTATRAAMLAQL